MKPLITSGQPLITADFFILSLDDASHDVIIKVGHERLAPLRQEHVLDASLSSFNEKRLLSELLRQTLGSPSGAHSGTPCSADGFVMKLRLSKRDVAYLARV